jgi:hypothetical protein
LLQGIRPHHDSIIDAIFIHGSQRLIIYGEQRVLRIKDVAYTVGLWRHFVPNGRNYSGAARSKMFIQ